MVLHTLISDISAKRTRTFISCCLLSILLVLPTHSTSRIDQLQYQIIEIDSKIQNIQSNITSCNNTLIKLAEDSSNAVLQFQSSQAQRKTPLSNLEMSIATASKEVEELKKQIIVAKQDSIQLSMKYDAQKISLNREHTNLQQLLSAASNNIKTMNLQRDQYLRTASLTSNSATTKINAENARIDLLLSKNHNELANLGTRREQLMQDSIIKTTQLQNDLELAAKDLKTWDSLIASANQAVQLTSNRLSQVKQKRSTTQTFNNQNLQSYTTQRAKALSSLGLTSANLTKNQNEYKRIRSSLDAITAKYEKGKVPLQIKIRKADSTLNTRELQKSLWTVMRDKFTVDSAISVARNELDEIIQKAAMKRKNATKLTETKEAELNALMGKLDLYLQKPGVKQTSAQLASLTSEQKKSRIREVLTNIENDIVKQTALKEQASLSLSAYEKNNPAASNPSMQQLQQLDKAISSLQTQKDYLSSQKDSLDALATSQSLLINKTEVQFQKEIRSLDSSLSVLSKKSIALSSQRSQKQQNYNISQKKSQNIINKIISDLNETDNRISSLNREIAVSENRKEQLKADLANTTQSFEQQKIQAAATAQNLVEIIAKKEQEFSSLNTELQQLTLQNELSTQQFQNAIYTLRSDVQLLNNKLLTASSQYQSLLKQQNEINSQLFTSEHDLSRRTTDINKAIASTKQKHMALQSELQQLTTTKNMLLKTISEEETVVSNSTLPYNQNISTPEYQEPNRSVNNPPENNKPAFAQKFQAETQEYSRSLKQYDSLIVAREEELSKLRAQRKKTLQDSIVEAKQKTTNSKPGYQQQKVLTASKAAQPTPQGKERQIQSQKIIEKIYSLLGEGKESEAYRLFTAKKEFLKSTSPMEAIRILESTFDSMQFSNADSNSW